MAIGTYSTERRPSVVSFAFGRVWYGGIAEPKWSDTVLFSQVITDTKLFGNCYQEADPTSEEINSLVASDGGTIVIPGLGRVLRMVPLNTALVILATNGIWAVLPGQDGFSPSSYSVQKISEVGVASAKGVAKVEDSVIFVAHAGIYRCFFSREAGGLTIQNISQEKIDTRYRYITKTYKNNSAAVYDEATKRIHFFFGPASNDYRLALSYIPRINAWYEFNYPDTEKRFRLLTPFAQRANSTGPDLRFICSEENLKVTAVYKYTIFFGSHNDANFKDWFGIFNYSSFLETPPITLDNPQFKKQAMYLTSYFYKTESGFEQVGDDLIASTPSGCNLTTKWSWHGTPSGNKWSDPQQIYRMRRGYVPEDENDDYDDGVKVITTKTKIRGRGHSLSMRFEAEDSKDMRLIGYTLSMQMEGSY